MSVCVGPEKPTKTDKIVSVFRHKTDMDFVGAHPSFCECLKWDYGENLAKQIYFLAAFPAPRRFRKVVQYIQYLKWKKIDFYN